MLIRIVFSMLKQEVTHAQRTLYERDQILLDFIIFLNRVIYFLTNFFKIVKLVFFICQNKTEII